MASVRPVATPAPKWGLPQPVAVVAMAGRGAVQFALVNPLVPATPVPTPLPTIHNTYTNTNEAPVGCHRWRYTLHWDRPSRLATLKNALGSSVTIYKNFKAPGAGTQDDWPDPIVASVDWSGASNAGAWNWESPPPAAATGITWKHDCDDGKGGPACKPGENPGISYAAGFAGVPTYKLGPGNNRAAPYTPDPPLGPIIAGTDPHGEVVDWQWTLNYGYGMANDIIYGLDPGPPLPIYNLTSDTSGKGSSGLGGSIPGLTGTPLNFLSPLTTRKGFAIGDPDPKKGPGTGGANQPTWETWNASDVVGITRNQVNWGLMTFQDISDFDGSTPDACADPKNYSIVIGIKSDDSGNVSEIEDSMRLKYYSSGAYPGLSANGGTPTKGALRGAGDSLFTSWKTDPKKQCLRPWGVILCTDGQSTTCNTGASPGFEWDYKGTDPKFPTANGPCEADVKGSDFVNYPPVEAEAVYNLAFQFGAGEVIKPRTYAIGIAPEVSRCELNRIAYRGRSDARAARGDAGFLLFDQAVPATSCALVGDRDLPHIDATTVPPDESGPAPTPNRFRQDQGAPPYDATKPDYAFFAEDTKTIVNAFLQIVASTASGDYSTSAPVSGGAISLGSIVLLPSTDYPAWTGHLRAFDTAGPKPVLKWDAATVLNDPDPSKSWQPTPLTRSIYTWNPKTGDLIPVVAGNLAAMKALAGPDGPAFTANVVDFVRGFDGTLKNVPRFAKDVVDPCKSKGWLLGPLVNSTPAVVGGPYQYKQFGNVADHRPFEATYASRRPLAWIGSDDGMLHAFDFNDGTEVLALLPPNMLGNQVSLYKNFEAGAASNDNVTGQVGLLDLHTWGVANSFRFADVYFGAGGYRTVGLLTEGPGGDVIAAIDITHPFPGYASAVPSVPHDPNYDAAKPVQILWTKDSSDPSSDPPGFGNLLHGTWSVPALAPDGFSTSRLFFGAGINPASLRAASQDATAFVVDPRDGTLNAAVTLAGTAAPSPLVGQQSFADGVFFQTKSPGYLPDNVADLDLQADLNGQIWFNWKKTDFTGTPNTAVGIDLNSASGTATTTTTLGDGTTRVTSGAAGTASPQPLYYPPAATGQGTSGCQIYAMASGSLYETSPTVSGWNVNRSGDPPSPYPASIPPFTPYLYVGVGPKKIADAAFGTAPLGKTPNHQYILKQRVADIPLPALDPLLALGQTTLGPRTQVTSAPLMVVDSTGVGNEKAVFLLYDPDAGCNGRSYVVILNFSSSPLCSAPVLAPDPNKPGMTTAIETYGAGVGAASGITLTDKGLFAAKSGIGRDASASLTAVPVPINSLSGIPTFVPVWWRDVK